MQSTPHPVTFVPEAHTDTASSASTRSTMIVAGQFAVVFVSAMLPTPLYPLYRQAFGFGGITLTLVYAVYVLGNLLALLVFGRLADQIGRRRVALPAIGFAMASTLVFLLAADTAWLYPARMLSGFATGLSASAAAAWLADLLPAERRGRAAVLATGGNFVGLAVGPLFAGALAAFAPWPLRLSYAVYLVLLAAAAVAVCTVPETVANPRRRWSDISLAPRLGVPADIRFAFLSPAVTGFATFSMIGFYGALIPNLLAESIHLTSPLVAGAVVFELFAVATVTLVVSTGLTPRVAMLAALVLLPLSLGLLVAAEHLHALWLMATATACGGIAAAFGYRGSLQVVNALAPADRRSETVSVFLLALFVGNSVPVIGIALLAAATSPAVAHMTFAGVIAIFAVAAFALGLRTAR